MWVALGTYVFLLADHNFINSSSCGCNMRTLRFRIPNNFNLQLLGAELVWGDP